MLKTELQLLNLTTTIKEQNDFTLCGCIVAKYTKYDCVDKYLDYIIISALCKLGLPSILRK